MSRKRCPRDEKLAGYLNQGALVALAIASMLILNLAGCSTPNPHVYQMRDGSLVLAEGAKMTPTDHIPEGATFSTGLYRNQCDIKWGNVVCGFMAHPDYELWMPPNNVCVREDGVKVPCIGRQNYRPGADTVCTSDGVVVPCS